jgi:hypothetical protein
MPPNMPTEGSKESERPALRSQHKSTKTQLMMQGAVTIRCHRCQITLYRKWLLQNYVEIINKVQVITDYQVISLQNLDIRIVVI